jgi:hypothetical protein
MHLEIPWDDIALNVIVWALTAVIGWVVGRVTSTAKSDREERQALYDGVRALLRSELMRTHHQAVRDGYASTVDKEVMERTYWSYHQLGGNGIATNLHDEMMALPTKDD